jgi:hypothetical protein
MFLKYSRNLVLEIFIRKLGEMGKLIYSGNEVINLRELLMPTFKFNLRTKMEGYDKLRTFTLLCKLLAKCILMGGGGTCLCDFCETSTLCF